MLGREPEEGALLLGYPPGHRTAPRSPGATSTAWGLVTSGTHPAAEVLTAGEQVRVGTAGDGGPWAAP